MGLSPLHVRQFNKSLPERIRSKVSIAEPKAKQALAIQEERQRRYDSGFRHVEIAFCLWDTMNARSIANRFLSGKAVNQDT